MRPVAVLGPLLTRLLLALALFLPTFGGALAQQEKETQAQRQQAQPYNNAPVWRDVRSGKEEYTSVKGRETGVLVQTFGETWRQLKNGWITPIAGWLVAAVALIIGVIYARRGMVKLREKRTGRLIQRFTPLERWAHWTVAISFCILGVSGLIMMIGKYLLLPVIGYTLFAWLTQLSKNLHNFVGPVFIVGVVLLIVLFVKYSLPRAGDLTWLLKWGGMLSGEHVPSGMLNAGQKMWFWGGLVVLSLTVSASGLIMDFPNFDQSRWAMMLANIVHSSAAGLVMALSLYHIYMGTIGIEDAYEGMRYGYVDETYAKEHHEYWYHDIKAGKIKTETAVGAPVAPQVQH
jgi:formate dehydrogenase subunit gamma